MNKQKFTRKNGTQKGGGLYTWSPETQITKNTNNNSFLNFTCLTPLGEQGNDNVSTYSFEPINKGGLIINKAYVQCDYVK